MNTNPESQSNLKVQQMNLDVNQPENNMLEKRYISINSKDRNFLKYPMSSNFEIELPQSYEGIVSAKLDSCSFPSNANLFSVQNNNVLLTFQFDNIYNPSNFSQSPSNIDVMVYNILLNYRNAYQTPEFIVMIEKGFYDPFQITIELTNRMNDVVTQYVVNQLTAYDAKYGTHFTELWYSVNNGIPLGGYNDFTVVYNIVQQNVWFGNSSSTFTITQNIDLMNKYTLSHLCNNKGSIHNSAIVGLGSYIGFNECAVSSKVPTYVGETRFYYGSVNAGDNGYWLTPNPLKPGSKVSFLVCPFKINNLGQNYIYLDIDELNCIDQTMPFLLSNSAVSSSETTGSPSSCFAKIPIVAEPVSQFYFTSLSSYKVFNPPASRISRLKLKIRYHDGTYADFSNSEFSLTIEFTILRPQITARNKSFPAYS